MMYTALAKLMLVTALPNVSAQLMPLVLLALMIDAFMVVIWYYIGVALNNSAIKGSALGEFYQFIGTVVMIGIIIGTLVVLSSAFYSTMGVTKLLNPGAVSTLCTNIESKSGLDILGSSDSLLSGPSSGTGNFVGICSLVQTNGPTDLTSKLDYPLAAVSVVVANLTNQTAANYNSTYVLDSFLGFLSSVNPSIAFCVYVVPEVLQCIPNPFDNPVFRLQAQYAPFAGYSMILTDMTAMGTLLNLSTQSFVAQMLVISMFIYAWPFLLFGGFVLRGTLFTRKLGGLLIAIALGGLIIYPTIFAFEYLSLGNGIHVGANTANPNGVNTTYGYNAITAIPATNGNYVINFFVEPNIAVIANTYNCFPTPSILGPRLVASEEKDVGYLMIPGTGLLSLLGSTGFYQSRFIQIVGKALFGTAKVPNGFQAGNFYLPDECMPGDALNTFYAILNSYGLIGVTSFFLPLINIIITLSSIIGLSQLFGGDTELAGLGRLL